MQAVPLVSTIDMEREDWLKWRTIGIGGSDAAAIAGLNKWKSPITVWLNKTAQVEPEEAGEAAYWGNLLEDVIAKEFSKRTGLKVWRRNAILQHPDHPFMIANLDRIIMDKERGRGVLEIKTTSAYRKEAWDDGKIPDEYMIQVQHYLAVTGLQYAYIAVLIGGQEYKHQYIPRDEDIINYLIRIESDFWELVEKKMPPAVDGSDASSQVLSMLYPQSNPDTKIRLPDDAEDLISQFEEARLEEKAAKERKDEAANKLKALLAEAEVGVIGDYEVSWKTIASNRLDTKALKTDMPHIYEKYAKQSETRRFSIK